MNKALILRYAVALACLATVDVAQAAAQAFAKPLSVGFGGGFSESGSAIGYHALATLEFPLTTTAFRLRADGMFADWGTDRVTALTANLLLAPVSLGQFSPYALAGAGGYAQRGGGVRSGWTLGLGVRVPVQTRSIFFESRLHTFRGDRRETLPPYDIKTGWRTLWTPIGVGVQF